MCISLCIVELGDVHHFQKSVAENSDMRGGLEWQRRPRTLHARWVNRSSSLWAAVFRLINTESLQDAWAVMEPFIV